MRQPYADTSTLYQLGPVPVYTINVAMKPRITAYTGVNLFFKKVIRQRCVYPGVYQ